VDWIVKKDENRYRHNFYLMIFLLAINFGLLIITKLIEILNGKILYMVLIVISIKTIVKSNMILKTPNAKCAQKSWSIIIICLLFGNGTK